MKRGSSTSIPRLKPEIYTGYVTVYIKSLTKQCPRQGHDHESRAGLATQCLQQPSGAAIY